MAGGGGELEALDPLGDDVGAGAPTSEGGHRRRRRWPIVAVAAVVVTVAIGFPVRDRLARREFHDLQHQWAVALADDTERGEAENRLRIRAVATNDEAFVDAALAALYREEQRRFDESRARLHRSLLVAPSVISIRAALATALARRSILLGRVAAYWDHPVGGSPPPNADDQTAADGHRVDVALSTARAHFGERQQSSASAVAYGAERSAMSRLSHWLDQRTGTVLLAGAREQLLRLDIDASRVTATDVHSPSGDFVMRQGYLAYTSGSEAWAVSPDGSGPPRRLAAAAWVLAAADPTAIWVVDPSSAVASEIDGTGRTIAGPVRVDGVPAAATADALVETPANAQGEPQPGLVAWSVVGHKAQCRVGGDGVYAGGLAVSGNLLAWSDNPAQVHITDMTTCVERWKVPVSSGADPSPSVPVGAFSPDGRTLALGGGSVDPVTLVDVASGAVTSAPTEYTAPVVALVWSADSSRLFWLAGLGGSAAALLTWHVGDAAAEILRAVGLRINPPLLAVP